MKVLIGIITRNRASHLPLAINSALAQNYPDKQIAVLDIASTDETPSLRAQFPQVMWERVEERLGIPESRNLLMSRTDARYFFSLDDDAWFLRQDEIMLGVNFLEEHPDYAAVAYDILLPGDQPAPGRGQPRDAAIFTGCGHLLRLSDVAAVNYYALNPTVYGGSEETDLCLRLYARRKKTIFLPGVHVWHERTAAGRNLMEQYRHNLCNDLVSLIRRCPLPDLFLVAGWRLFSQFRFAIQRGRMRAYFAGVLLFLKAFPKVIGSRAPVPAPAFRSFMRLKRADAS
jgi:GT2 family glycosyltransferase